MHQKSQEKATFSEEKENKKSLANRNASNQNHPTSEEAPHFLDWIFLASKERFIT
jgi:hypothetical protein